MSVGTWSRKRLVAFWIAGVLLELVLFVAPVAVFWFSEAGAEITALRREQRRANRAAADSQRSTRVAETRAITERSAVIENRDSALNARMAAVDSQLSAPRMISVSGDYLNTSSEFPIGFSLGVALFALVGLGTIPVALVLVTVRWRRARATRAREQQSL